MLYQGEKLPDGTKTIDVDALDMPQSVLNMYKADLKFCLCLLNNNGSSVLPSKADAWRSDTTYFCDVVETVNRGIGISGRWLRMSMSLDAGWRLQFFRCCVKLGASGNVCCRTPMSCNCPPFFPSFFGGVFLVIIIIRMPAVTASSVNLSWVVAAQLGPGCVTRATVTGIDRHSTT